MKRQKGNALRDEVILATYQAERVAEHLNSMLTADRMSPDKVVKSFVRDAELLCAQSNMANDSLKRNLEEIRSFVKMADEDPENYKELPPGVKPTDFYRNEVQMFEENKRLEFVRETDLFEEWVDTLPESNQPLARYAAHLCELPRHIKFSEDNINAINAFYDSYDNYVKKHLLLNQTVNWQLAFGHVEESRVDASKPEDFEEQAHKMFGTTLTEAKGKEPEEERTSNIPQIPEKPYRFRASQDRVCALCDKAHDYRHCHRKDAQFWRRVPLCYVQENPEPGNHVRVKEDAVYYDVRRLYFCRDDGKFVLKKNESVLRDKPLFAPDTFLDALEILYDDAGTEQSGTCFATGNYVLSANHAKGKDPHSDFGRLEAAELPEDIAKWAKTSDIAVFRRQAGFRTVGKPEASFDKGDEVYVGMIEAKPTGPVEWLQHGNVLSNIHRNEWYHTATTKKGFSGSPVFHIKTGRVVGVHVKEGDGISKNVFMAFTQAFVDFLNAPVPPKKKGQELGREESSSSLN